MVKYKVEHLDNNDGCQKRKLIIKTENVYHHN